MAHFLRGEIFPYPARNADALSTIAAHVHPVVQHDEAKLQHIHDEYSSGRMLSGEIKAELVNCITPIILAHQKARAAVTAETVRAFMSVRKLKT